MMSYFEALTDVPQAELDEFNRRMQDGSLNPVVVKRRMAREIVTEFHSAVAAEEAEAAFIEQFSKGKLPVDIPDYRLDEPANILNLLVDAKLAPSKSEARRLVQQGGVTFFPGGTEDRSETVEDIVFIVPVLDGAILKVGKRQYVRIRS
jgi:tyrosyl-tRNA synthetase